MQYLKNLQVYGMKIMNFFEKEKKKIMNTVEPSAKMKFD